MSARFSNYHATIRKDGYMWVADLYKDGKPFMMNYLRFRTYRAVQIELEAIGVENYWKRMG